MSVVSQSTDIGYTCTLSLFKGTVSVISSDSPCKDVNVRFTTVPLKHVTDHILMNTYENTFIVE